MDINTRIGIRVRELRDQQDLSLDALAERSGVSRSSISLIERAQSSPTAIVLDRLATGLGVSVASLFESTDSSPVALSPMVRATDQAWWTDPDSGYVRRTLSPTAPAPIQLIEVSFPAGGRVAYEATPSEIQIHQQLWMLGGTMEITVDDTLWCLETGDCLAMSRNAPIMFRNTTDKPASYLMAVTTRPFMTSSRRSS